MAQTRNLPVPQKSKSYLTLAVVLFLTVFAGKFIVKDALPYFGFDEETFGRYWNVKWPLIGHISGGLIALLIGPFQFWKTFRNKFLNVHRVLGRVYLIAILIGTIASTFLAWTSGYEIGFTWALALQFLAFAWIASASMAYLSVMRKRIVQHKEWMIRSYVITFAFVLFRWLNELEIARTLMPQFTDRGPTLIWLSWVVPLFITEMIISFNKKKSTL
ncbi:DUF2306 domain-containing protein [Lacibacter luteus]|uniref:DUF2306 domain-containing protein n=1 Tax=Lacibacter luteus TaxID=2508719 RepID=A0A4Q1CJR1_9BACT|nr:DUF2306 domain-containing protein [Lacibacter luteus]RXK60823.1 DUF2306 domain-containing protein [Lacibacter luteus]